MASLSAVFMAMMVVLVVPAFSAPAVDFSRIQNASPMDASRNLILGNSSVGLNQNVRTVKLPIIDSSVNSRVLAAVPLVRPLNSQISGPRSAFVSAQMNKQNINQSFVVGNGPIVAILPAGSNFSATWDLMGGSQPTISFEPLLLLTTLPSRRVVMDRKPLVNIQNPIMITAPSTEVMDSVPLVDVQNPIMVPALMPVIMDSVPLDNVPNPLMVTASSTVDMDNVPLVDVQNPIMVTASMPEAADSVQAVPVILPVGVMNTRNQSAIAAQANDPIPVLLPVGIAMGVAGVAAASSNAIAGTTVVQQNHRVEIQLIDFQMNNSLNSPINENFNISVKLAIGALSPAAAVKENITLVDASMIRGNVLPAAETTSDMQQVFNGNYKTSINNKVTVAQTVTQDLCGQITDMGYLTVMIAPVSGSTFKTQVYTCAIDLNFPTAVGPTESYYSEIIQCNSGTSVNGFSNRLWYKKRMYNVGLTNCQQTRPGGSIANVVV